MSEPAVRVTLDDIYAVVVQTKDNVTELNQTVRQILKDNDDHEHRIRHLEQSTITKKAAFGLTAVVSAITAAAGFLINLGNQLWSG